MSLTRHHRLFTVGPRINQSFPQRCNMKKINGFLAVVVVIGLWATPAFAIVFNGNFETGDLSGFYIENTLQQLVDSYPTVNNVDDGTGNRVGEVRSGSPYVQSERFITLGKDLGALPDDVQDLFFDVKMIDLGPEDQGGVQLSESPILDPLGQRKPTDYLYAGIRVDGFNERLFSLWEPDSYSNYQPYMVSDVKLENGFQRFKVDISRYAGNQESKLMLTMINTDDGYNRKFWVDNIDLKTTNESVVPEPSTIFLLGGGLAGMLSRRRNHKKV